MHEAGEAAGDAAVHIVDEGIEEAGLAMFALCHLVIGMDLDTQIALGIDELDEQG